MDVRKRILAHIAGGYLNHSNLCREETKEFVKIEIAMPFNPEIPLLKLNP